MSEPVTLAGILGSQVSMQWFEAVALVREVADRLIAVSSERGIPELQQIRLSAEGRIDIVGVTPTDEPVRRMGQLLQALLAQSEAPLQLRLVVTQATAPAPQYKTIREYSEALAFFERPERSTVLQQLAMRVSATAANTPLDRRMTLDAVAPLPVKLEDEEKKQAPPSRPKKASPALGYALVALVVLLIAGGAAWVMYARGMGPQNREQAVALADRASDAMGTAIVQGASAVTETLGLGRIVPAKDAAPAIERPAPTTPPAAKPAPPKRRDNDASAPAGDSPIVAFDLDPRTAVRRAPAARPESAAGGATPAPSAGDVPGDATIYSPDIDAAIVPPVGVRPKLARQLPPDFDPNRLGRVELIIGVDGSVESVKLLGPPRTVNDGLFLSVAKAWKFEPALKNGVPVRYKKTIWVASP